MDRRTWNKGTTLTEVCLVLVVLSFLSLLQLRMRPSCDVQRNAFAMRYLYEQSEAMRSASIREYTEEESGKTVRFNGRGNVSSAGTVWFGDQLRLIIELGGGRLVFR
ncbi:MAG: hypothetical protein IKS37_00210 [Solobacterium sp.]|nr:hypothetical protein [Solobacterium sp.]